MDASCKTSWRKIIRRAALSTVAAVVVVLLLTCMGVPLVGRGGLGWFNPYSVECRSQSEFTLLEDMLPIYRSTPQRVENELLTYAIANGFVTPIRDHRERWDLIFHWHTAWRGGEGQLYRILYSESGSIIAWSNADRQRAEMYWSEAFKGLRSDWQVENEIGVEVLRRGWRTKNVKELKNEIYQIKRYALFDRKAALKFNVAQFPDEPARIDQALKSLYEARRKTLPAPYTFNDILSVLETLASPARAGSRPSVP